MYKNWAEIEVLFVNNFFTPKFLDILFVSFFNGPFFWKYRPKYISNEHSESEIFSATFPKIKTRIQFFVSHLLSCPYPGHLRSYFVVLLLLVTAWSRKTRNVQKQRPRKVKFEFCKNSYNTKKFGGISHVKIWCQYKMCLN